MREQERERNDRSIINSTEEDDDDDDISIPDVIFVQEKTLLCRWDGNGSNRSRSSNGSGGGCNGGGGACGFLGTEEDDQHSTSSLLSEDETFASFPTTAAARPCPSPPRAPKRTYSPPPPARKERDASRKSGIDVGSIPLVPVSFTAPQAADSEEDDQQHKRSSVPPLMACDQASPLADLLPRVNNKDNNNNTYIDTSIEEAFRRPKKNAVTVVFCIRREGCAVCRSHGQQLTQLVNELTSSGNININMFGIVKSTLTSSQKALRQFYKKYFPYPIYIDEQREVFQFLGNRKVSIFQSVFKAPMAFVKSSQVRNNLLKQHGPWTGDHFTQGGILLFDTLGQLRYVYYERFGDKLDTQAIQWAIRDCYKNQPTTTNATTSTDGKPNQQSPQQLVQVQVLKADKKKKNKNKGDDDDDDNNNNNNNNSSSGVGRGPRLPKRRNSIRSKGDKAALRPARRGSLLH